MNENTFVENFFFDFNILSHVFLFFLHFCLLSHFKIVCIVKSLLATFVEIQLKKRKLKRYF